MSSQEDTDWCRRREVWCIDTNFFSKDLHHNSFVVKPRPEVSLFCSASVYVSKPWQFDPDFDHEYNECRGEKTFFAYELKATKMAEVDCSYFIEIQNAEKKTVWTEKKKTFRMDTQSCKGEAEFNLNSVEVTIVFNFAFAENDLLKLYLERMKRSVLLSDFAKPLLQDKTSCDTVIVCQDRTFNCHKIILGQRSEVFKAMLTGDFREGRENKVDITEFAPDVVEMLLKYVYEDEVPEEAITWELFEAAKMYQLDRLKEMCKGYLRKNLSVDSCCQMLEASSLHDLNDLFSLAVTFIRKNRQQVVETEGWERVKNNKELMEKIVFHQTN